jgi:hypothetical protein
MLDPPVGPEEGAGAGETPGAGVVPDVSEVEVDVVEINGWKGSRPENTRRGAAEGCGVGASDGPLPAGGATTFGPEATGAFFELPEMTRKNTASATTATAPSTSSVRRSREEVAMTLCS